MKMDEKDTHILKLLLADSRQSARKLSLRMGLSTVTMISRIKRLEEQKVIQGYSVRLDHELLGYELTAVIEITTNQGKMLEIENHIAQQENVIAVYDITGNADILVIAKFKDRKSLSIFVKKLSTVPNVENTVTHIVLNTIKEDERFI
ncbi:Lrp/AsnC family transcriptional regulator [Nitrosopumilus sp. b2]|uniref:Lrp/AsnC family transcriptional regulator n=1 Tax=Nitrosopumilus sp. b2 TaxID=2109908 RepID=UPI0015F54714|nr:Lrp/AsnC family transcriptional regulator [Nitrosopumilus sp. b2]KAF6244937.1 AsnC family transcriptional regulator [Nitrosopumilus sp. b2]